MSYNIVIPMVETIHISKFRICGVSKRSSKAISVHYDQAGKRVGRTVKNSFGEPNHFGRRNEILGYSRKNPEVRWFITKVPTKLLAIVGVFSGCSGFTVA